MSTLALGIGANAAIFSVVNAVLLRPLMAPEPDRVVFFMNTSPQGSEPAASPAKFAHWRQQTTVVEHAAAFNNNRLNFASGDTVEQFRGGRVSAEFFQLFGAPVMRGRTFSDDEDRPNGVHVAVLSHGLWTRRFGSDPQIVGARSRSATKRSRLSASSARTSTWRIGGADRPPKSGYRFSSI